MNVDEGIFFLFTASMPSTDITMNNVQQGLLKRQFYILKWFVYHLTYYRILSQRYEEHNLKNEFWTLTIGSGCMSGSC
jgi:hypothetical protein